MNHFNQAYTTSYFRAGELFARCICCRYIVFLWWSWRYYSILPISHTLHFWIDISFLENCNVNAIRTWLFWFLCQNTTLEFLANPRIFLLVHTTAATAACPIIEFFFLMPPNNNNRISNEYKKCLSLFIFFHMNNRRISVFLFKYLI